MRSCNGHDGTETPVMMFRLPAKVQFAAADPWLLISDIGSDRGGKGNIDTPGYACWLFR